MGKRGPKPLPDSVLEKRGSNVPRTRERKREQLHQVVGGPPSAPTWLSAAELEIWKEIAPKLLDMGVISVADGISFGRYCHAVAEWISITTELRNVPRLVRPKGAAPYQHPLIKVKHELAKELQALEDRFGLTPAARMTLNVTAMFRPGYKAPTSTPATADAAAPSSSKTIDGERFFRGA